MASFRVTLKTSVEKDLKRIDRSQVSRILRAVEELQTNPFPLSSKKLVGSEQTYRLRVGDYRIVYIVNRATHVIEVHRVRHRKEVYR